MPSWEFFEQQDAAYREQVLPEASRPASRWSRRRPSAGRATWVRRAIVGMHTFGASAPLKELQKNSVQPDARRRRPGTDRHGIAAEGGRAMVRDTHVEDAALSQALETNPAGPCAMMIFGAGGDLTKRPAAPALYNPSGRLLPEQFGFAHRGLGAPT